MADSDSEQSKPVVIFCNSDELVPLGSSTSLSKRLAATCDNKMSSRLEYEDTYVQSNGHENSQKVFSTIQATLTTDLVEAATSANQLETLYAAVEECCVQLVHHTQTGTLIAVGSRIHDIYRLQCKLIEFIGGGPGGSTNEVSFLDTARARSPRIETCLGTITPDSLANPPLMKSDYAVSTISSEGVMLSVSEVMRNSLLSLSESSNCLVSENIGNLSETAAPKRKRGRPRKEPRVVQPSVSPVNTKVKSDTGNDGSLADELNSCFELAAVKLSESNEVQQQLDNSQLSFAELELLYESGDNLPYMCMECPYRAKQKYHLVRHARIHNRGIHIIQCPTCPFHTVRAKAMKRHKASGCMSLLRCPVEDCSYQTTSRKRINQHNARHHSQEKPFRCSTPGCHYRAASEHRLDKHVAVKHRVMTWEADSSLVQLLPGRYRCLKCGYESHHRSHFQAHLNARHRHFMSYLCDTCGRSFKRKEGLVAHSRLHILTDPSNFPFCCATCGQRFRLKGGLVSHQSRHMTARPFLCDLCGMSFKSKSVQQKHIRTVHSNPQAYFCPVCNEHFSTRFALKRHTLNVHELGSSIRKHRKPRRRTLKGLVAAANRSSPGSLRTDHAVTLSLSVVESD